MIPRNIFQIRFRLSGYLYLTVDENGNIRDFQYHTDTSQWRDYISKKIADTRVFGYVPDWLLYCYRLPRPYLLGEGFNGFAEAFSNRAKKENIKPYCRVALLDLAYADIKNIDLSIIPDLSVLTDSPVFFYLPEYLTYKEEQQFKARQKSRLFTAVVTPSQKRLFDHTAEGQKQQKEYLQQLADNYFQPCSPDIIEFYEFYDTSYTVYANEPETACNQLENACPNICYELYSDDLTYYRFTSNLNLQVSTRNNMIAKLIYTAEQGYDIDMTGTLPRKYRKKFSRTAYLLKQLPDRGYVEDYRNRKNNLIRTSKGIAVRILKSLNIRGWEN